MAMIRKIKRYGWKPDLPDHRDRRLKLATNFENLPLSIDLSAGFPLSPADQGDLGSCTANATVAATLFDQQKQGLPIVPLSRLYLYYFSRLLEGSPNEDSGATISDVFRAYNQYGCCPEDEWPYDITQFAASPPTRQVADALPFRPVRYARVDQCEHDVRATLAGGYPIVYGISVFESFENSSVADTGDVPLPLVTESLLGGHCTVLTGYDHNRQLFLGRNSWGTEWGKGGYYTIPYSYVLNPDLASDFWVLEQVSEPVPLPL